MAVLENSDKVNNQQSNEGLTENEILNILSEDDNALDKKETKEEKSEKEEEELKLETEEDIEKVPEEDELEIVVPIRRKEILKKYPNLFKEFPYLEKAYYREQQYTEVFATLDDAKEASERSKTFDEFEKELAKGSTESVLKSVKESDEKAFAKIVDNYLPILAKVDQGAYYHILGNVIKSTIVSMIQESENIKNDDLKAAAVILNQFIFGNSTFKNPTSFGAQNTSQQGNEEESNKLSEERAQFLNERFEMARDDLSERVNNVLKNTISEHIDPKQSMTPYVKKTAVKDCQEELENLIDKDDRFRTVLDNLWKKAFEDNFSKKSLDQIRVAYLSKSKTLLPQIISNVRKNALQGFGRGSDNDNDRKGPLPIGKDSSSSKSAHNPKEIPKNVKTLDYLMQD